VRVRHPRQKYPKKVLQLSFSFFRFRTKQGKVEGIVPHTPGEHGCRNRKLMRAHVANLEIHHG